MNRLAWSFCRFLLGLVVVVGLCSISTAADIPINVTVTADNVYGIYTGTLTGASQFVNADNSWPTAETYNFNLPANNYIYVVSYSDDVVAQGFLAQFTNQDTNHRFYSSDPQWQVTATGINKGTNDSQPTVTDLTSQILLANAGTNSSGGWVSTSVGPQNLNALPWGTIANIDAAAHWTWYDSGKDTRSNTAYPIPFDGFNHDEYLIFRIPVNASPVPEPSSAFLLMLGAASIVAFAVQGQRSRSKHRQVEA